MHSYHKEATVGGFVILGVAAFFFGSMWLRGKTLGTPDQVLVRFANVGNLKVGGPVRVSGAAIGKVEQIDLLGVGQVVVGFTYDKDLVTPTQNGKAVIVGIGMLGDMAIDFEPGTGAPLTEADTLVGTMTPGFADIGADLAGEAQAVMQSLNRMLDTGLVVDLRRTLTSTDRMMTYFADPRRGPTAEVSATMRSLQVVSAQLDSTLRAIDAARLSSRVDSTMRAAGDMSARIAATSARMDSLLAKIARGDGTLGKLANDEALYDEIRKTMAATAALIDEMKKDPGKIGITIKMF